MKSKPNNDLRSSLGRDFFIVNHFTSRPMCRLLLRGVYLSTTAPSGTLDVSNDLSSLEGVKSDDSSVINDLQVETKLLSDTISIIQYGDRSEVLKDAHDRIAKNKYGSDSESQEMDEEDRITFSDKEEKIEEAVVVDPFDKWEMTFDDDYGPFELRRELCIMSVELNNFYRALEGVRSDDSSVINDLLVETKLLSDTISIIQYGDRSEVLKDAHARMLLAQSTSSSGYLDSTQHDYDIAIIAKSQEISQKGENMNCLLGDFEELYCRFKEGLGKLEEIRENSERQSFINSMKSELAFFKSEAFKIRNIEMEVASVAIYRCIRKYNYSTYGSYDLSPLKSRIAAEYYYDGRCSLGPIVISDFIMFTEWVNVEIESAEKILRLQQSSNALEFEKRTLNNLKLNFFKLTQSPDDKEACAFFDEYFILSRKREIYGLLSQLEEEQRKNGASCVNVMGIINVDCTGTINDQDVLNSLMSKCGVRLQDCERFDRDYHGDYRRYHRYDSRIMLRLPETREVLVRLAWDYTDSKMRDFVIKPFIDMEKSLINNCDDNIKKEYAACKDIFMRIGGCVISDINIEEMGMNRNSITWTEKISSVDSDSSRSSITL